MKKQFIIFIALLLGIASCTSPQRSIIHKWSKEDMIGVMTALSKGNCSYKGIKLHGKVKFVNSFPDIKIKYVSSFPDIKVKFVSSFPDRCGEWKKVNSFPDFKVKVVNSFPDLKVKVVNSFPGM